MKKKYLFAIVLIIFLSTVALLNSQNVIIQESSPADVIFNFENVNVTTKSPSMSFEQIVIADNYIQFNDTKVYIDSTNPINFTLNHLASNLASLNTLGTLGINFTAKCSSGTAWFNISGFNPGYPDEYTFYKNGTYLGRYAVDYAGVIHLPISSWSWGYITGVLTGSSGTGNNIRSDGTYLYMTMEDGLPPYSYFHRGTHLIDTNSTIEGKYCLNITYDDTVTAMGSLVEYFNYDNSLRPDSFSIKFKLMELTDSFINVEVFRSTGAPLFGIQFKSDYTIKPFTSSADDYYTMHWNYNTIYKINLYDIDYNAKTFNVQISNATASETKTNKLFYTMTGGTTPSRFGFTGALDSKKYRFFIDDWTVGTQSVIDTDDATLIEETSATLNGELINDGSPLQNASQSNHSIKVLYDTQSHPTNYTYYFNESSTTEQWDITPDYMNDDNENTYAQENYETIKTLHPIENGSIIQCHPSAGLNYECVDDETIDGDSTYTYWASTDAPVSAYDYYNTSDYLINKFNVIKSIQVTVWASHTDVSKPASTKSVIRINGITYEDIFAYATYMSYTDRSNYTWTTNPATGETWSWTDLFSLEFGYKLARPTGGQGKVTQVLLRINYHNTTQFLTENTGNTTSTPTENISKIEIRAKSYLSSDANNGRINLQPVFNLTNGSSYNIFSDTTASWSDWIDITNNENAPTSWTWANVTSLKCRAIANLTQGTAYVGKVELRIAVNTTREYAHNQTVTGSYHGNTVDTDTFSKAIGGLTPGQLYFYRTYINTSYVNSSSYCYGDEEYFLTKPEAPTNFKARYTTSNTINISLTKGTGSEETWIRKSTSSYPSSFFEGTNVPMGSDTYYILTVTPDTNYYFSAWGISSSSFGDRNSDNYTKCLFIRTINATSVEETTATLNAYLISNSTNLVRFQYNYTTAYGTNTTNQTKTGIQSISNYTTGLTQGRLYHFRALAINGSNTALGQDKYFLTKPESPTNQKYTIINKTSANISWTKGTGANNTLIVRKSTGYPSSIADGDIIYNDTGTYKVITGLVSGSSYYYSLWSFTNWTFNPTLHQFSDNHTDLPFGALALGCYNESKPWQNITFNVLISNQTGSEVYKALGCTTYHTINVTKCPHGLITMTFSAEGYKQRVFTITINPGLWLVYDAYLPPLYTATNDTTAVDCEMRSYSDSITITNHTIDATINLTYALDTIIDVQLYNKSLYGTYGGWVLIASDKYNISSNTKIIVNTSVIDANTTMVKVDYYYQYCPGIETKLYLLSVVNQNSLPIRDAFVTVKRYMNTTDIYETILSGYTDGNGQIDCYLIPLVPYKVFITKEGYIDEIVDYIPSLEIFTHTFMLECEGWEPMPSYPSTHYVHFTGVRRDTRLYVNYTDDLSETINTTIYIYEIDENGTEMLLHTFLNTTDTVRLTISGINKSRDHKAILYYRHETFGNQTSIVFMPRETPIDIMPDADKPLNKLNNFLTILIGYNPFGWGNFLMLFFLIAAFYYMDQKYAGIIMMFLGGIFLMLNVVFGFDSTLFTVAGGAIPMLFIIVGVMYEWVKHKKKAV
jgi:hypothetical protein